MEFEKIWIDQNLGVFINYPKKQVISSITECFFGINKITDDNAKEKVKKETSDSSKPGLATLISTFIDILIKTVSQGFAKVFLYLKNIIDKLIGIVKGDIKQIKGLLDTYIPGLQKVFNDISILF